MARRLLSDWNQIAPRSYIRTWYCFPYRQNGSLEALKEHLTRSLDRLSMHFPDLTGKVFLLSNPKGRLCIGFDGCSKVPLQVFDQRDSFGWTYAQLKAEGFPAKAFVHYSFDLPYQLREDQQGIPVLEVHARVIEGGLLLCIYIHHSISDGTGMDNFISSFAEVTRDTTRDLEVRFPVDIHIDLPEKLVNDPRSAFVSDAFHKLLGRCTEYCLLSSPIGPTQFRNLHIGSPLETIQKTGRIFVFTSREINHLKETLARVPGAHFSRRLPSTFTCLAAITWAYTTKARLSNPINFRPSSASPGDKGFPEKLRLMVSVNWRCRAFSSIMSSSAGNTIALPITTIDTAIVLAVCSSNQDIAYKALATVVRAIDTAVHGVGDAFVTLRTALIRASPDPRLIGIDIDPRDPCEFYFNTWRPFGTKTRWKMPGLEEDGGRDGVAPDAIRRAQSEWNMGAGLILPKRKDNNDYEVLVTLETGEMAALCADPGWRRWVDRVVE